MRAVATGLRPAQTGLIVEAMKDPARLLPRACCLALAVGCLAVSNAPAGVVQIDAFDRGAYTATGQHVATLQRTITGYLFNTQRSFFAFDLTSISGMVVTSATLVLQVVSFEGNLPEHEFFLYDVGTPVSNVVVGYAGGSPAGQAIFADLGTGATYGSGTVPFFPPFGLPPPDRILPLSPAALEDLTEAAGGLFALGVHVTTAPGPVGSYVSFSNDTAIDPGPWRHYLVLETAVETPRISSMSISNDVVELQFRGLPVGSTVAVQRTVAIMNGWNHVESFVPSSTRTNWSEPRSNRVHALYRLTGHGP